MEYRNYYDELKEFVKGLDYDPYPKRDTATHSAKELFKKCNGRSMLSYNTVKSLASQINKLVAKGCCETVVSVNDKTIEDAVNCGTYGDERGFTYLVNGMLVSLKKLKLSKLLAEMQELRDGILFRYRTSSAALAVCSSLEDRILSATDGDLEDASYYLELRDGTIKVITAFREAKKAAVPYEHGCHGSGDCENCFVVCCEDNFDEVAMSAIALEDYLDAITFEKETERQYWR